MKIIGLLLSLLLFCNNIYSQGSCPGIATVDYSGKTYHTVAIGDQCWLKENLDIGTRIDGSSEQTDNGILEKYCYNDSLANCALYGGLYQWNEAMQYETTAGAKGICPTGWHIPTHEEYGTLTAAVSDDGNALKAVGQGTGSGAGTNTSGFSALLAGYRYLGDGHFYLLGIESYIWSSTEMITLNAYLLSLDLSSSPPYRGSDDERNGFSIRCLNDLLVSGMPVELDLFTAAVNVRTIQLKWETETEVNFNKFEIDRALISTKDASVIWTSVGSVQASGTSTSPKKYSFTEKDLQSGKYQYKLKMIDNDGTFKYSKVIEAEVAVPKNYELSQNFPNPFNPNTVISYSLPLASNLRLIVFNSLGQKVKVIENGFKNAGNYSVNFIASDLPSGVYFYRIQAGSFVETKKMMLLK